MTVKELDKLKYFFNPKSVALIGASNTPGKVGHDILKNIIDYEYKGKIFPINPFYNQVLGYKCYPNVKDISDEVDLAIIAIPAKSVLNVVKECGEKKIKNIVIISAGFKEIGREGALLEKELQKIGKKYKIRIQGPNCLGVIDTFTPLNATFAGQMPLKGNIAFISQSGALGTSILDWSLTNNIGFSKFISLGNKVDLDESDFILSLAEDDSTKVILLYIEDVKNGEAFLKAIKKTVSKKPILVLKSGQSITGQKAAVSHTGSLAGSNIAYQTAFKQYGIIEVKTIADLFDYAMVFSSQLIPKDNQICILTNAGGPGIIATDCSEKNNLKLAELSKETLNELQKKLPNNASFYNPIDILGDAEPDRYFESLKLISKDENVSAIILILTPQISTKPTETAQEIVKIKSDIKKPLATVFMGGPQIYEAKEILTKNKIPVFNFPEDAVESIAAMVQYSNICEKLKEFTRVKIKGDKIKVKRIIENILKQNRYTLLGSEASEILQAYNIKTPKIYLVDNSEEAIEIANKIGYPIVMKIASPDILHKSDVGGVKLNINNDSDTKDAFIEMVSNAKRLMPNTRIYGVELYEQAKKGKEVIIGVNKDVQFGHLIMFGLGGIYVNFLKDVSFRLIPIYKGEALKMIKETKTYSLLKGVRGEPESDIESIISTIENISQLVEDFPIISELDINPLFVYDKEKGSLAVDAKITLYKGDG